MCLCLLFLQQRHPPQLHGGREVAGDWCRDWLNLSFLFVCRTVVVHRGMARGGCLCW